MGTAALVWGELVNYLDQPLATGGFLLFVFFFVVVVEINKLQLRSAQPQGEGWRANLVPPAASKRSREDRSVTSCSGFTSFSPARFFSSRSLPGERCFCEKQSKGDTTITALPPLMPRAPAQGLLQLAPNLRLQRHLPGFPILSAKQTVAAGLQGPEKEVPAPASAQGTCRAGRRVKTERKRLLTLSVFAIGEGEDGGESG